LPTTLAPGREATRADAGVDAAATSFALRFHSISEAGISDRNRDGVWNAGRPHQFRDAALVR
jgi:hypothetical protein